MIQNLLQVKIFTLIIHISTARKNSFSRVGVCLWNQIPAHIRKSSKQALKKQLSQVYLKIYKLMATILKSLNFFNNGIFLRESLKGLP